MAKTATTTSTTVATILTPVAVDNLLADARSQHVEIVKHLPAKLRMDFMREMGFAKALILRGPQSEYLRKCNPKSLMTAFINSASLGLTLNPIKKHCTIIARWNKDAKEFEADNLIMYQGLLFLATQAGVRDVIVEVVYEADEFEFERTENGDKYRHKINLKTPRGSTGNPFLGVYVAAKMPNSDFPKVEWIPADDIYRMRERSDSYLDNEGKPRQNSPWVVFPDEMYKKSGLKRAQKRWEELVETNEQWNVFKQAVDLDNTKDSRIIDGDSEEVVEPVTAEQAKKIEEAIASAKMNKPSIILDAYHVDSIAKLPADKFEEILNRINEFAIKKREKQQKTEGAAK